MQTLNVTQPKNEKIEQDQISLLPS